MSDLVHAWYTSPTPMWPFIWAALESEGTEKQRFIAARAMAAIGWRYSWRVPIEEASTKALVASLKSMLGLAPGDALRALDHLQRAGLTQRSGWHLLLRQPKRGLPDLGVRLCERSPPDTYALSRRTCRAVLTARSAAEARAVVLLMIAVDSAVTLDAIADVLDVEANDVRAVLNHLAVGGLVRISADGAWSVILQPPKAVAAA